MHQLNEFSSKAELDESLATFVAKELSKAIAKKGKASLAVSGGSTPKGFFKALSLIDLPWKKVNITLADERWVDIHDDASNTRLVHENLMVNFAKEAKFFHLKQAGEMTEACLVEMADAASTTLMPLDVLILGMGEDGHTASLFPCSEQITQCLSMENNAVLMKVIPQTAPHDRITFTLKALLESKNTILHIAGTSKKQVLDKALSDDDAFEMPIRAFLKNPEVNTQVFWAE